MIGTMKKRIAPRTPAWLARLISVRHSSRLSFVVAALLALPACLSGCGTGRAVDTPSPALGSSTPFLTPPREPTRKEKLYELLKQPELPSESQIRKLGSTIDSDLANVVNNRQASDMMRVKAVKCLGYFQNKRARLLLRSVLTDPSWQKPFRLAALVAMAHSMGAEAFETTKEYTLDADSDMRLAAVRALVIIDTPAALALLKSLQLRERDADVMNAIDDAIRSMGKSRLEVN